MSKLDFDQKIIADYHYSNIRREIEDIRHKTRDFNIGYATSNFAKKFNDTEGCEFDKITIWLATKNDRKVKEFSEFFKTNILHERIRDLFDVKRVEFDIPEIDEPHDTYRANSEHKATKTLKSFEQTPYMKNFTFTDFLLTDDSGFQNNSIYNNYRGLMGVKSKRLTEMCPGVRQEANMYDIINELKELKKVKNLTSEDEKKFITGRINDTKNKMDGVFSGIYDHEDNNKVFAHLIRKILEENQLNNYTFDFTSFFTASLTCLPIIKFSQKNNFIINEECTLNGRLNLEAVFNERTREGKYAYNSFLNIVYSGEVINYGDLYNQDAFYINHRNKAFASILLKILRFIFIA
jgi:inosine/xanthosine triphosphate pyrophosphatase family protein